MNETEKQELCKAAREAARKAYAPYSRFRVGAAVLGERGIYVGANIENASYGLSLCAERAALIDATMKGERNISAIAVACIDASSENGLSEKMPCGACRQWFVELASNAEIIIDGEATTYLVDELLPYPFSLKGGRTIQKAD